MSDTQVYVTTLASGTAIDNVSVTTGAGTVNRQRTTERDIVTETDASLTVTTSAQTAISGATVTNWLKIQNCSQSGQVLGYTTDGSTPVIGAAGTLLLLPYGSDIFDKRLPAGAVKVIGSAASTIATIKYA